MDGPTLVDLEEAPVTDVEDPVTLNNAKLSFLAEGDEERTIAEPAQAIDDFGPTQRVDEASEVTVVDRAARHSEPP